MRILRYYLKGDKAGTSDVLIDNLAGFPDNIRFNDKGELWIALFKVRDALFDHVLGTSYLRNLMGKLPLGLAKWIGEFGKSTGAMKIDSKGKILEYIEISTSVYRCVTTAVEFNSKLYIGSINHPDIGVVQLK